LRPSDRRARRAGPVKVKSAAKIGEEVSAEAADLAVTWGDAPRADAWAKAELVRRGGVVGVRADDGGTGAPDEVFEVDADNVAAAKVFLGCATQWRISVASSLAGSVRSKEGLDYAGVSVVASSLNVALDIDVMAGLQLLERTTLEIEARSHRQAADKSRAAKGGLS
jgi:hypothetical protein